MLLYGFYECGAGECGAGFSRVPATKSRRGRGGRLPVTSRADPSTRAPSPQATCICGVCSKAVVDGEDDALLCEGPCACWLHRSCAGITHHCYDDLSKSSSPFVYYGCSLLAHRSEVSRLQSEVDNLKSVVAGIRSSEVCDSSKENRSGVLKTKDRPAKRQQVKPTKAAPKPVSKNSLLLWFPPQLGTLLR